MRTGNLPLTLIIAMAATAAMAGVASAATPPSAQAAQHAVSQAGKHEAYGVVKAVNVEAGKVQLAHEAIPSLQWPAMTMWFTLRNPLPKEIKVGDSVRFELEQSGSKEWVISRIERKR